MSHPSSVITITYRIYLLKFSKFQIFVLKKTYYEIHFQLRI